ncbi:MULTISPECIES: glycoside hydrolase family 15 protein [unclassified Candidatus Frackibacter]|uniref:glycoside hydrolase family 15 protein n=1 Tax=unclassified Candidatus Frackibacter TaxID=2648818 RepID=UPI00088B3170|nr:MULTISPECIES: glycoside hydrolase family 15 protein [unclassified Candidatus Frackibacter]SDC81774.1 oligosaccharide amylase [Candidatus Frackibacter sp. WG11]SEM96484.1 oligosaccharide amylase [Candidatus Frackibacter sp. WG12]SFM03883.1 oligosaccharide amylase [Candidatus Frackibacter sp. WG13]
MARDLVIGNGNILINFDQHAIMRDFYYPYVGSENHLNGHKMRIGVMIDDNFYWVDESWEQELGYKKNSLVTDTTLINSEAELELEMIDAVHYNQDIYLKKVKVKNLSEKERSCKLFFSHDFRISGSDIGNTALYEPMLQGVMHYKGKRYFLINGQNGTDGIYNYSTGIKGFKGAEGTWRDAEDGDLASNPIAQGSVDSTISFKLKLSSNGSSEVDYWIAAGTKYQEVKDLNNYVLEHGIDKLIKETDNYWSSWVNKNGACYIPSVEIPEEWQKLFNRSLLTVRTQIDNRGAITAANDSDILDFNRDHYSYLWPRDGALVAYYLDQAGYHTVTERFFNFCKDVINPDGYLLHKYNPDGSVGSSWHPWIRDGKIQLPIQEDETALVIFALGNYYRQSGNLEFIQQLYEPLIKKAADFLVDYRDQKLKLPRPSYDLWEERRGILTFTTAAVYGALQEAATFADMFGDKKKVDRYQKAAQEIKEGMLSHLYDQDLGRFIRMISTVDDQIINDEAVESSLFGVYYFGVLPPDDPRVVNTMQAIEEKLWVKTTVGGIARYEGDYYFRSTDYLERVPGNPWIISTLWLADWYIEIAKGKEDLKRAEELINWVVDHTYSDNLLPEQIHPYKNEGLSVAPLTWSHATFVGIMIKYQNKLAEFNKKC